jgi:hypothetical protein
MKTKPGPLLSALSSEWLARGWSLEDLPNYQMAITAATKTTDFSGFLPARSPSRSSSGPPASRSCSSSSARCRSAPTASRSPSSPAGPRELGR